jgi:hypothetical protein
MRKVIYKMYNPRTEEIFLSLYNSKKYEVIEELEVPEDEEPEDYLLQLRTEVDLGEMCERSTRY